MEKHTNSDSNTRFKKKQTNKTITMSKGSKLNLPDGILQLYQRRYSDPTPSSSQVFHKPGPRRFSLTTFDDLKDVSSRSVRTRLNKVLHCSGYTQYDQAKTSQTRRYSLYADTNVENDLGERGRRRSSFADKIQNVSNDSDDNDSSRKRTYSDVSRKKSLPSYWNDKDLEEYQTHLSAIKPSPYRACDDQYWLSRRCKSVEPSDTSQKIPKCKYKLRQNGTIASELSSAYGVHIQCMDRNCSRNSTQSQPRARFNDLTDLETRPPSTLSCYTVKKSNASQKYRPDSSPGSVRASPVDFVRPKSSSLQWQLPEDENFKYSFYNPAKTDSDFSLPSSATPTFSTTRDREIDNTTETRSAYQDKPRRLSNINFELIGNPSLHGSPMYSGRLKLCSYRSYSFGN